MELSTASSFGFNVRRAHRAFDRLLSSFLKPHGLKTGYWYYLRALWSEDHVSQKRLSELNNVTENTTAAIIAAMERDGLIVRQRDPKDARKRIVSLTLRGALLREQLLPYALMVNAVAAKGIDHADLMAWLDVTQRMADNIETALRVPEQ